MSPIFGRFDDLRWSPDGLCIIVSGDGLYLHRPVQNIHRDVKILDLFLYLRYLLEQFFFWEK
jgi:hypothetical protein